MPLRAPQVGVASLALGALGAFAAIACDSPARSKPWRHAPDPTTEAAAAPGSPVLSEAPSEADVHAARAHTLRIHVDAEPGRLSPIIAPSLWAHRIMMGTVFETLLRYEPPAPGQPAAYLPGLAKSWQVMPGGQEIRVELDDNITFHDGRPLTTSDVQFTLDAIRDPRRGIEQWRPLLDDVEAIELITAKQIRLRLKRPSGWALRALAEIPILPMHVYDGSLLAGGALVGSGPWRYVSNKAGIVHLTRYEKYWRGPSPIADVEFVYQPDAAVALTEAKRGELDIIPALIPAHWPEQANAPGVAAELRPLELAPPRFRFFAYNAARPPLDDARVRHALALLVDRRAIAKRVFSGLARPALWPIWPGGPVNGAESPVPDFDPAAAGKLLDAAGWIDTDKDGIRDKDGKPLHLVMIAGEKPAQPATSEPAKKTERDYFVDAAKRVGVVVEVKTGGEAFLQKRLDTGAWDVREEAWGGMADGDLAPLVASGKPALPGAPPAERPASPRVDRALDAMTAAFEPAERAKLAGELAAGLAETWPLAGIVADAPQGLVHKRVKHVVVWGGWIDLTQLTLEP